METYVVNEVVVFMDTKRYIQHVSRQPPICRQYACLHVSDLPETNLPHNPKKYLQSLSAFRHHLPKPSEPKLNSTGTRS